MKTGMHASCVLKYVLSKCVHALVHVLVGLFIVQSIIEEVDPKFSHISCSQVV